jgi:transposase-like protein
MSPEGESIKPDDEDVDVWQEVIPFFAYPAEIRKIIYTNAIGSPHMQLRKEACRKSFQPEMQIPRSPGPLAPEPTTVWA